MQIKRNFKYCWTISHKYSMRSEKKSEAFAILFIFQMFVIPIYRQHNMNDDLLSHDWSAHTFCDELKKRLPRAVGSFTGRISKTVKEEKLKEKKNKPVSWSPTVPMCFRRVWCSCHILVSFFMLILAFVYCWHRGALGVICTQIYLFMYNLLLFERAQWWKMPRKKKYDTQIKMCRRPFNNRRKCRINCEYKFTYCMSFIIYIILLLALPLLCQRMEKYVMKIHEWWKSFSLEISTWFDCIRFRLEKYENSSFPPKPADRNTLQMVKSFSTNLLVGLKCLGLVRFWSVLPFIYYDWSNNQAISVWCMV